MVFSDQISHFLKKKFKKMCCEDPPKGPCQQNILGPVLYQKSKYPVYFGKWYTAFTIYWIWAAELEALKACIPASILYWQRTWIDIWKGDAAGVNFSTYSEFLAREIFSERKFRREQHLARGISIRGATEGGVTRGVGIFRFWIFEKLGFFEKGLNRQK